MHVVISCFGTQGHVVPALMLGEQLARRGHEVVLQAPNNFAADAVKAGLCFVPLMSEAAYRAAVSDPLLWEKGQFAAVWQHVWQAFARGHAQLAELARPGETVLVGTNLALWTRVVAEQLGCRGATLHPSPFSVFSAVAPPRMDGMDWVRHLPPPLVRAAMAVVETLRFDPVMLPDLNGFRARLGLKPVNRVLTRWTNAPDLVMVAAPAWFAPPAPDWPNHAAAVGFAYRDAAAAPLPELLAQFLDRGAPPVLITPGSGVAHAGSFFARALEACAALGRRAVVITPFRDQLPSDLPDWVHHAPFLPFAAIVPRAAALVHAGGIGTIAHAFAAGVPQLLVPLGKDQFDNAARAAGTGAALTLGGDAPARSWRNALGAVISDPLIHEAARACARRMAAEPPAAAVMADLIEMLPPFPADATRQCAPSNGSTL